MPMGNKKPKGSTKAPLAKGGWFCLWQNRGDKRPAGFHIGWYFEEVPTVNPSVTPTACQLPLAREPLRAAPAANFARQLSATRYFPDPPGIGGQWPQPMRTGIFSKSLLPLQCPVTIPGKNEAQTKAPLAKGGCLGTAEAGGFRRQAGVHIGLCFW